MFIMCNKCGYLYDDTDSQTCPQCGAENEINGSDATNDDNYSVNLESISQKEDDPNLNDLSRDRQAEQDIVNRFKENLKNRQPKEDEQVCPFCGNIQSKDITRCLKCSQMIPPTAEKESEDTFDQFLQDEQRIENTDDLSTQNKNEQDQSEQEILASENAFTTLGDNDSSRETHKDASETTQNSLRNLRKISIISLAIIFVIALVAVIVVLAQRSSPIKIDLSDYVSSNIYTEVDFDAYRDNAVYSFENQNNTYESESEVSAYYSNVGIGVGLPVYGYNEYATIDEYSLKNIINWYALKSDINDALSHKKEFANRAMTFDDFFTVDSFEFSIDMSDNLSNGDAVVVTVSTLPEYTFNDVTIEITGCSQIYTISNLETARAFNPFEYVTFIQYGANGYASVGCQVEEDLDESIADLPGFKAVYYDDETLAIEKDDYIIAKIEFYFESSTLAKENYKNGDTVTMFCNCSNPDLMEENDIYIGKTVNDYTFNGLGEFITKSTTISQEDLDKFIAHANGEINERFSSYSSYSNPQFNSAYVVDYKDKTESSSFHNYFCLVYSYTYSNSWSNEQRTEYLYVTYENLIISDTGEMKFTPEDYFEDINSGFDSVEEILTYEFDSDYNVVKVG